MNLLDQSDKQSPTWQKIKAFYEKRLTSLREGNDDHKRTPENTAYHRGRIAECKAILALDRELPTHEPDNPPDAA